MNTKARIIIFSCFGLLTLASCEQNSTGQTENAEVSADTIRNSVIQNVFRVWYPRVLDQQYGGYLSNFNYRWEPLENQEKFLVTQSRNIWTTSKAAHFDQENSQMYQEAARHGFLFLKEHFWDQKNGGFFTLLNQDGSVRTTSNDQDNKRTYGNAFALYGLAAYYELSGDTSALNLAKKGFHWLEEHAHDPVHLGYFQNLTREGDLQTPDSTRLYDLHNLNLGFKDQNTSIHLLEAFAELYKVWPDSLLKVRTEEMLHLIRDVMVSDEGYLRLFFLPDWTPVSLQDSTEEVRNDHIELDHVSFGHDIETAYLMLEATHILGNPNDQRTLEVAKKMVDHTIDKGWDTEYDGIYYGGYYLKDQPEIEIFNKNKTWWAQAEALNSLLLMSGIFPHETRYKDLFQRQWDYLLQYQIDYEYGGWYSWGLDRSPDKKDGLKAQIWKGPYHNGRALMNTTRMLEGEDILKFDRDKSH
jgi:mannobiose 2-epimerase